MITIPTTELIGCLSDVLPQISDPKNALAGVKVEWDGESLHFTTYDVFSGATVTWTPGEGAEGTIDEETSPEGDDISENWGGDDAPWRTWIGLEHAKEILKLFKLPAKLWRFPVTVKCSLSGDRLTIERTDSPKGERLLSIPGAPDMLKNIPDVPAMVGSLPALERFDQVSYSASRLGAFGNVRPHGVMEMSFGGESTPTAVTIGSRFTGFVYPSTAKDVRPYSFLRDASGLYAGGKTDE